MSREAEHLPEEEFFELLEDFLRVEQDPNTSIMGIPGVVVWAEA